MGGKLPDLEQGNNANVLPLALEAGARTAVGKPLGRARGLAAGASVMIIASGAAAFWFWQWSGGIPSGSAAAEIGSTSYLSIQRQSVSAELNIVGTIGAARSVGVVAPFDGVISEKKAQVGDAVQVGDILLTLDAGDITSQYRTAQSAFLKAQMAVQTMQKWESSADVLRAKRALEASEASLSILTRQLQDIKALFGQGIVSRNEYEGVVQQRDNQQTQVESNRQDFQATLQRGDADNRQLLELDLQNAADKLNELKQQLSGAKIASAVSGVLTRPPAEKGSEKVSVEPGARVTRGAPLFAIADTTSFVATGMVDEVDVNRIKVGQPATISSDGIPGQRIAGKIVTVSAEALQQQGAGQAPSFQVRVSFVPQITAQRQAIRLGMSARISIQTYANPEAIVVPPAVVTNDGNGASVVVIRGNRKQVVPVSLGETFPVGIEVLSGLMVGDQVSITGDERPL